MGGHNSWRFRSSNRGRGRVNEPGRSGEGPPDGANLTQYADETERIRALLERQPADLRVAHPQLENQTATNAFPITSKWSLVRGERPKVYVWGGVTSVLSSWGGFCFYVPSLVSMGKLVRGGLWESEREF